MNYAATLSVRAFLIVCVAAFAVSEAQSVGLLFRPAAIVAAAMAADFVRVLAKALTPGTK